MYCPMVLKPVLYLLVCKRMQMHLDEWLLFWVCVSVFIGSALKKMSLPLRGLHSCMPDMFPG